MSRVPTSWRTVHELAEDLRFTITAPTNPDDACRAWLRRHRIVGVRRGRTILISAVDVDRALRASESQRREARS